MQQGSDLLQSARIIVSGIVMAASGLSFALGTPSGLFSGTVLFASSLKMFADSWSSPATPSSPK